VEAAFFFVFSELYIGSSQSAVLGGATLLELGDEPEKFLLISLMCSQNLRHHIFGDQVSDLFD